MVGDSPCLAAFVGTDDENLTPHDKGNLLAVWREGELGRLACQGQPLLAVLKFIAWSVNCQLLRSLVFHGNNPKGEVVFVDNEPTVAA